MNKVVTFGEIMGRVAPRGFLRFRQALPGALDFTFAGAEATVAASVAYLGGEATFVTALPKHALGDACVANLKAMGVDTQYVQRTKRGRLGLYFLETGANQRPSNVIYDRESSAISLTPPESYPWAKIFAGAGWFHISGITPAISALASAAALAAVQAAHAQGVTVSCDLNFRRKLWSWEPATDPQALAQRTMRKILPFVDVVIGNEEDAGEVLGIHASDTDVQAGKLATDKYPDVARQIVAQFPQVKLVAITLRESISASHNNWGAMLFDAASDRAYFAPLRSGQYQPYQITHIVDRVGGGDAFAAGLIFARLTPGLCEPQTALSFAVASSCLAHSIVGDYNFSSRAEVEALMGGSASGRVVR
ncbi:MAG: sugar kinase [Verrucomicrobia bacterium]|nr:MAG: sugar kinase [Verrucomicrobiota bacterium]